MSQYSKGDNLFLALMLREGIQFGLFLLPLVFLVLLGYVVGVPAMKDSSWMAFMGHAATFYQVAIMLFVTVIPVHCFGHWSLMQPRVMQDPSLLVRARLVIAVTAGIRLFFALLSVFVFSSVLEEHYRAGVVPFTASCVWFLMVSLWWMLYASLTMQHLKMDLKQELEGA